MDTARHYIFLGPPGSGKGTQAKELANILGIPHVSTGEIFRDNIARGTELGKKVDELLKAGRLVSDDVTNAVVSNRLKQTDAARGVILDGFPRSLPQAEYLATLSVDVLVVLIELPDDEAVQRISGRRTCSQCGAIYHIEYKPASKSGVCDTCGGELKQRNDETEEVIRGRLSIYHKQTEPLIKFYTASGQLIRVNGLPPISEVTAQMRALLKL